MAPLPRPRVLSARVMLLALLSVLFVGMMASPATSQTINVSSSIIVQFLNSNGAPVPGPNAVITVALSSCIPVPAFATSFNSSSNRAVFAIYEDANCGSYLYSVASLLPNLHGAKGLVWDAIDLSNNHTPGETFTNPALTPSSGSQTSSGSSTHTAEQRSRRLIQIAVITLAGSFFFLVLGGYLCWLDNKRNRARGGYVPDPYNSSGHHRNMAEVSGPGRGIYDYNHHRHASSASTISYLPPYGSDGHEYYDTDAAVKSPPKSQQFQQAYPTQYQRLQELPKSIIVSRNRSFSLTNEIGTGGIGTEPAIVHARREGFGLGYDLDDYKGRDPRRDSDILMSEAMMTPPHSPGKRPSSIRSEDLRLPAHSTLLKDGRMLRPSA